MAQPYHRGSSIHNNNHNNMTRNNTGGGDYNWGTREQRVEEANMTLLEMENNQRWVCVLFPLIYDFQNVLFRFRVNYQTRCRL